MSFLRGDDYEVIAFQPSVLPQLKLEFGVDRVILQAKGGSQNDTITKNFHRSGKSRHHFDRDQSVELEVPSTVHNPHAACANDIVNFVSGDLRYLVVVVETFN